MSTQPVTVDASIFVNAFSPSEEGSDKSWEYINSLRREGTPIIVPALVLPEIVSVISRKHHKNSRFGIRLAEEIRNIPNLALIPLDEFMAEQAVSIAATYNLRSSDAIYAAVALRFGTDLITLDREQLTKLGKILSVKTPEP
jgi:predicted nucleic acid-binding protein